MNTQHCMAYAASAGSVASVHFVCATIGGGLASAGGLLLRRNSERGGAGPAAEGAKRGTFNANAAAPVNRTPEEREKDKALLAQLRAEIAAKEAEAKEQARAGGPPDKGIKVERSSKQGTGTYGGAGGTSGGDKGDETTAWIAKLEEQRQARELRMTTLRKQISKPKEDWEAAVEQARHYRWEWLGKWRPVFGEQVWVGGLTQNSSTVVLGVVAGSGSVAAPADRSTEESDGGDHGLKEESAVEELASTNREIRLLHGHREQETISVGLDNMKPVEIVAWRPREHSSQGHFRFGILVYGAEEAKNRGPGTEAKREEVWRAVNDKKRTHMVQECFPIESVRRPRFSFVIGDQTYACDDAARSLPLTRADPEIRWVRRRGHAGSGPTANSAVAVRWTKSTEDCSSAVWMATDLAAPSSSEQKAKPQNLQKLELYNAGGWHRFPYLDSGNPKSRGGLWLSADCGKGKDVGIGWTGAGAPPEPLPESGNGVWT